MQWFYEPDKKRQDLVFLVGNGEVKSASWTEFVLRLEGLREQPNFPILREKCRTYWRNVVKHDLNRPKWCTKEREVTRALENLSFKDKAVNSREALLKEGKEWNLQTPEDLRIARLIASRVPGVTGDSLSIQELVDLFGAVFRVSLSWVGSPLDLVNYYSAIEIQGVPKYQYAVNFRDSSQLVSPRETLGIADFLFFFDNACHAAQDFRCIQRGQETLVAKLKRTETERIKKVFYVLKANNLGISEFSLLQLSRKFVLIGGDQESLSKTMLGFQPAWFWELEKPNLLLWLRNILCLEKHTILLSDKELGSLWNYRVEVLATFGQVSVTDSSKIFLNKPFLGDPESWKTLLALEPTSRFKELNKLLL